MKNFLTCLAIILFSTLVHAQNNPKKLSATDSLKVKTYWDSANYCKLFSVQRQLYLDSALAIMPWNAFYWQQKAMPLYKQKKYEIALPYLDSAVKYNRKKYMDYRAFMKCIFQKSYSAAISDFNEAEVLSPNGYVMDHSYHFYKGLCYLQLNQFDSSIALIKRSIDYRIKAFDENWVHYLEWLYLGINYYELTDYKKAITLFDAALKGYPNFPEANYYKSLCLININQKEKALELLKKTNQDLMSGYSINEDNSIYEDYPYQVKTKWITVNINRLEEEILKK